MYHVYILKSLKTQGKLYIGYTKNMIKRLEQHNNGESNFTRKHLPWKLVYCESFLSLEDAKRREKSLKYFGKAYGQLKGRIKDSLNT